MATTVSVKHQALGSLDVRFILLILLLSLASALTIICESGIAGRSGDQGIYGLPPAIGGWTSKEVPVSDDVRDILETKAVLMREYRRGAARVLLTIVHYRDSRVALHLPESCYTGQGSAIIERGREECGDFRANKFLLEGNKGSKIVLYFFTTGGFCTDSYAAMRLRMLISRLRGGDNGCALVRISLERSNDAAGDMAVLKGFLAAIHPLLSRYIL